MQIEIQQVCTGIPQEIEFQGKKMKTSMPRIPQSMIEIKFNQVLGDKFLSPQFHGGKYAVVYMFSSNRLSYWTKILGRPIAPGEFGENLTVGPFDEKEIFIGDVFRGVRRNQENAQSVELIARGCRYPCSRLNFRFQKENMQKLFEDQDYPGIYFEVKTEGRLKPGDYLERVESPQQQLSIFDLYTCMRDRKRKVINESNEKRKLLLECKHLPDETKSLL